MMLENNTDYHEQTFDNVKIINNKKVLQESVFESCVFLDCDFSDHALSQCKFIDCDFKSCNLNLVTLNATQFNEVQFRGCKMTGINWTQMITPNIFITCPIHFDTCDISFSSFYEMKLADINIINCKAHEVDFRLSDLTSADLTGTDFEGSQFNDTQLKAADLRAAINYYISPIDNFLEGARFSLPEAIALLYTFNIEIVDS